MIQENKINQWAKIIVLTYDHDDWLNLMEKNILESIDFDGQVTRNITVKKNTIREINTW